MRISNVEIMGLDTSIVASGYPMRTETELTSSTDHDLDRSLKLTKASKINGAHAQFLTGIRVNFDLCFSNKAWVEAERYRFLEFVSSQSTMHRITKFNLKEQCNRYVDRRIIDIVQKYIDEYNRLSNLPKPRDLLSEESRKTELKNLYLTILYNIPSGFELTARMTTNYRCLLNIFNQRYNHRLPEWRDFCKELLSLPKFREFVEYYIGKTIDEIYKENNND